ncbi:HalOD1 output domain-containing protein [Halobaculum marinum]|uniref:HalOD1 output domain-containing protein n=1 Tax=Halobaculum marinum TaxID=3031996 RepID=A0ABD5WXI9_9EURY|nr:HalOD1 output domain-containing protein [Halobaculum sp. DT55]
MSERVVDRVATAEGVSPAELEARLYDAVDGDALDSLVAAETTAVTVTFEFSGYTVTVDGDSPASVTVEPAE